MLLGGAKCMEELGVDEELLSPCLHFFEQADINQLLQIYRRRLALGNSGINQVGNPAVRLHEDQFGQLAGVNARRISSHPVHGIVDQGANRLDS